MIKRKTNELKSQEELKEKDGVEVKENNGQEEKVHEEFEEQKEGRVKEATR